LQLIDAKINNDMKDVIAKLNELEVKIQMTNDKLSLARKVRFAPLNPQTKKSLSKYEDS
jgi:hypothetical protein